MEKIKYPQAIDLRPFAKDNPNPEALYGLPTTVSYCQKCVISNQRPNSAVEYKHTKDSKKPRFILMSTVYAMPVTLRSVNAMLLIGMIATSSYANFVICIVNTMDLMIVLCRDRVAKIVFTHHMY